MKKFFIGIISMLSIMAGTTTVAIAKSNQTENQGLKVRFMENRLIVSAPELTEARIYTYEGRFLNKETGKYLIFDLEQGTYVLFADVKGETIARKVILK